MIGYMTKTTKGTLLPRRLEQNMAIVGEQIKLARLRRNLSIADIAERATCSQLSVMRVEKGSPTVAIGIYLRVLYAMQLDADILLLAQKDELGRPRRRTSPPPPRRARRRSCVARPRRSVRPRTMTRRRKSPSSIWATANTQVSARRCGRSWRSSRLPWRTKTTRLSRESARRF